MTIEERATLLKELLTQDPTSKRARQILRSLQQYQPKVSDKGIKLLNPVTGTNVSLMPNRTGKAYDIGFSTKTGLNRPDTPYPALERLGIKATVAQGIDQIPPARGNQTGRPSRYQFTAMSDYGDKKTNQRAALYRRLSGGAFTSYPLKENWGDVPDYFGQGERITSDRWQPRTDKGKFDKYKNFDPTKFVRQLGEKGAKQFVARAAGFNDPRVQGLLTANDIIAYYTGFDPFGEAVRFVGNETFGTGPQERKLLSDLRQEKAEQSVGKYNTKDPDGRVRNRLLVGPKIVGPGKVGTMAENFDAAFAEARKAGKRTFTWKGNLYTTELK